MKPILFAALTIIFWQATHVSAESHAEENYQILERRLQSLDSSIQLNKTSHCLSTEELYQAAKDHLSQIETIIINALTNPERNKNLIAAYLKLWILGRLGSNFFDLSIPDNNEVHFVEIENYMFLAGISTYFESGKTYWAPVLIDIKSKRFSLLGWEHCQGKCYTSRTVWDTAYGICGVWDWDPKSKTISSFCHCGKPQDCGTQNIYRIEVGNLILIKSLRKIKCNGSSFFQHAKPCCVR